MPWQHAPLYLSHNSQTWKFKSSKREGSAHRGQCSDHALTSYPCLTSLSHFPRSLHFLWPLIGKHGLEKAIKCMIQSMQSWPHSNVAACNWSIPDWPNQQSSTVEAGTHRALPLSAKILATDGSLSSVAYLQRILPNSWVVPNPLPYS